MGKKKPPRQEAVFSGIRWDSFLLLRAPAANPPPEGWKAKVKPAGKKEVGHEEVGHVSP
jgi:hypothetical protein